MTPTPPHPDDCIRCFEERTADDPLGSLFRRMIPCPECGNKRCPKATDHRLDCTGSNEVGQAGSAYQGPRWPLALEEGETTLPVDDPPPEPLAPAELINGAIDNLEWCNTLPHTLDNVLRMETETARLDADADRSPAQSGSHADPTGSAGIVTRGHSYDEPADVHDSPIWTQINQAHQAATELDHVVSAALRAEQWSPTSSGGSLTAITSTTIARLHHLLPNLTHALTGQDGDWTAHMHAQVRSVSDAAAWLRKKAEGIYKAARPATVTAASITQKPLKGCVSCARVLDGAGKSVFVPVAHGQYADRCRWCGDYRGAEKQDPPVAAVEWMHRFGKRPTSKVLAEAARGR